MTAAWRRRIAAMVDALRDDERVVVEAAVIGEPASAAHIRAVTKAAGVRLPAPVRAFYRQLDGLSLTWRARAGDGPNAPADGSIELLPVARLIESWTEAIGDPDLHAFDLFADEACAAIPLGTAEPTVRFVYFGECRIDTGYTFTEYLDRLLESRGYWYWIQALSTQTSANPEAKTFLREAARLFVDFDPALFAPR